MNRSRLLSTLSVLQNRLVCSATPMQSLLLLGMRLYWGWAFFQTGLGKLQNHAQTSEFFGGLGIPFPGMNAWAAGAVECAGGALLILGLASRIISIPLAFTMIVAYLTAELATLKVIFTEPDKFTSADPFLFLLITLIIFTFGPGTISLDRWLSKRLTAQVNQA